MYTFINLKNYFADHKQKIIMKGNADQIAKKINYIHKKIGLKVKKESYI